jgi:hypothetical protein
MPANREPLHEASDRHSYDYRRDLSVGELAPVIAVAIGAGLAAFYVAMRLRQRTPLLRASGEGTRSSRPRLKGTAG